MKRHFIKLVTAITLIAIIGALVFTGCAKEEAPPVEEEAPPVEEEAPPVEEEAPPVEEVWEWPEKLAFMCGTGVGLASTTGYSAELAKDTGMTIRVVPEVSPVLRFKWVKQGRFFSVAEAAVVVYRVLEGIQEWAARDAGPFQIRIIWSYSKSDAGFIVRGDSDIKTIYDIKPGTKFADMVFYPGFREGFPAALFAWVGVDPDDIEWVPGSSYGAVIRSISRGQADISLCFPASPDVMEAAAAPHGIRFLNLPYDEDPEGAKRFLDVEPTSTLGVMSQSPDCMGVQGIVGLTPLMTPEESDPELVYHFAKWLDENYDLYKDNHAWNQYMTIDNLMRILETWFVPAHDGLIKYLKEKGLWTAAHDARQAQNVEFVTRYCDAYQEAIDMADDQGIAVDPENEEWLELWENYKKELGLPKCRVFLGLEE